MNFREYDNKQNDFPFGSSAEESRFLIVKYNFCPMPLNKTKIIIVNIETENKVTLGEALIKAIHGFNKIDENFRITEKISAYKLRYAKKSGLPDGDIPHESHLFSIPKYNYDPTAPRNLNKINSTCVSISKDDIISSEFFEVQDQKKSLINEDDTKKQPGFFARFCGCFIKKKQ